MAVGVNGTLWAWSRRYFGQLGLGDHNDRLVPTLVGAEELGVPRCARLPAASTTRWQ